MRDFRKYLSKQGLDDNTADVVIEMIASWEQNGINFWPVNDDNKKERSRLGVILGRAINGLHPVHSFVPVCPDYPFDSRTEELGTGIGETTALLLPLVKTMTDSLKEMSVPFCCNVILANTEIDLEEVISLLAGSQREFLDRCQKSIKVIREIVPEGVTVSSFSDFFKGTWHTMQYFWEKVVREKQQNDRGFNFWLEQLARNRTDKYQHQFGRYLQEEERIKMAIRHYAQYLTLGYFMRQYPGAVLVNTDSPNLKAIRRPFVAPNPPVFLPDIKDQRQRVPILVPCQSS